MGIALNLTAKEFQAWPGISAQLVVLQLRRKVSRIFTHCVMRSVVCNIHAKRYLKSTRPFE